MIDIKNKYCPECGAKLNSKDLHIVIILDESGSMDTIRDSTISAINEFIDSQRKQEGKTWVTLTKFDTEYQTLYEYTPIDKVAPLDKSTYKPDGCTALHDAIGTTINKLRYNTTKTMVVVMTDGQENSSREYTLYTIKSLIDEMKTKSWDFVFMGANIDSYAIGGSYGIPTTINWTYSSSGVAAAACGIGTYATTLRNTDTSMSSSDLQDIIDKNTD